MHVIQVFSSSVSRLVHGLSIVQTPLNSCRGYVEEVMLKIPEFMMGLKYRDWYLFIVDIHLYS